jgi:urease alpha subunit
VAGCNHQLARDLTADRPCMETNASLVVVCLDYYYLYLVLILVAGKVIREGTGQRTHAFRVKEIHEAALQLRAQGVSEDSEEMPTQVLDTLITNALIIDWSGIYKVIHICARLHRF